MKVTKIVMFKSSHAFGIPVPEEIHTYALTGMREDGMHIYQRELRPFDDPAKRAHADVNNTVVQLAQIHEHRMVYISPGVRDGVLEMVYANRGDEITIYRVDIESETITRFITEYMTEPHNGRKVGEINWVKQRAGWSVLKMEVEND